MKRLLISFLLLFILWGVNAQNQYEFHLSEVDLSKATTPTDNPMKKDLSASGNTLTLKDGVTATSGIGCVAPTQLDVKVVNAKRFRATVGIDQNEANKDKGSVEFKIIQDGHRVLWHSGSMSYNSDPQAIDIELAGNIYLSFVVTAANSNSLQHANWCNAQLTYVGDSQPFSVPNEEVPVVHSIYVSDLDLSKGLNGWGGDMKKDKSIDGNPLILSTGTYAKGLGSHAYSRLDMKVANAKRFYSIVGIDKEITNNESSVEFIVYKNGSTILWQSGNMSIATPAKICDIDITGCDYLTLEVTLGSNGVNSYDHADWCDAKIYYSGETAPFTVLKNEVVDPQFLNLHCAELYFATTGQEMMQRFGIESATECTITIAGLPEGVTFDSKRNLIKGIIPAAGTYNYTVEAKTEHKTVTKAVQLVVADKLQSPKPSMGWMSWNVMEGDINDAKLRKVADLMVSTGLKDAGFNYLCIDDLWSAASRNSSGNLVGHATKFPSGMKSLVDYIHSKGLKVGVYSDAAGRTCAGALGSLGYETKDATQFANWGFDYLKYDYCGAPADRNTAIARYTAMSNALKGSGRDMYFNICEWGERQPWLWAAQAGGHSWRCTFDTRDGWDMGRYDNGHCGVVQGIDEMNSYGMSYYAGPNRYNDADMPMVGLYGTGKSSTYNGANGMTDREYATQFAMWCLYASPLKIAFDLTKLETSEPKYVFTKNLLTNTDLIALNQDPLCQQATLIRKDGDLEYYQKYLANGEMAVGMLNRSATTQEMTITWDQLMLDEDTYVIFDVMDRESKGESNTQYKTNVRSHEVKVLRLTPKSKINNLSSNRDKENKHRIISDRQLKEIRLFAQLPQEDAVIVRLIDSMGRLVKTIRAKGSFVQIPAHDLPQGIYTITVCSSEKSVAQKFVY